MNARRLPTRLAVVGVMALALSAGLLAQARGKAAQGPTTVRVDGTLIKGYIEYMSSDDKEGRKSLTPGYEKVADWAAGKFKEWGLEARRRQRHVLPAGPDHRAARRLRVDDAASPSWSWTAARSTSRTATSPSTADRRPAFRRTANSYSSATASRRRPRASTSTRAST